MQANQQYHFPTVSKTVLSLASLATTPLVANSRTLRAAQKLRGHRATPTQLGGNGPSLAPISSQYTATQVSKIKFHTHLVCTYRTPALIAKLPIRKRPRLVVRLVHLRPSALYHHNFLSPAKKQQTYRNLLARHPHTRNRHLHRDPKHASKRLFAVLTMTHRRSCLLFTRESDRVGQFLAVASTCEEQRFRGRELRCRGARVSRVDICHFGEWLDERAGNEVGEVGW